MDPVIISVIGAPGVGKSFLVDKLAKRLNAVPMFEKVDEIPSRVLVNLKYDLRQMETVVWFRNLSIREMKEALRLKGGGKVVVMDTCPLTNDLYIPVMTHGFEKEILLEQARIDRGFVEGPDVIVLLDASEDAIRKFVDKRGRDFEASEKFVQWILSIKKSHYDYFNENRDSFVYVNRDNLDFAREEDVEKVVEKIKEKIKLLS